MLSENAVVENVHASTSNKQGIDSEVSGHNVANKGKKETVIPSHINLLIDKLSVTLNGFSAQDLDEIVKHVHSCNKDHEFFHPIFDGRYKAQTQIRVTPTSTVLMQVSPKRVNGAQIRFEWNPSKIGYAGHEQLKLLLDGMLPHGYDHLLLSGVVSRMDIAIDVYGVNMSDVSFFTPHACEGTKYTKSGDLQTVYLGGKDATHKWVVYNKAAQLKLQNGQEITRFEQRLKMSHPFMSLAKFGNPLLKLTVVPNKIGYKSPTGISPELWKLFRRAYKYEPCHMVLADLEKNNRQIIRQWLKGKAVKWWKPEQLWHSLPKVLAELGMLSPLHGYISAGLQDKVRITTFMH